VTEPDRTILLLFGMADALLHAGFVLKDDRDTIDDVLFAASTACFVVIIVRELRKGRT